ncbi:hypothetical protein FB471_4937 [Amycolatopsis cihanbeyliensis]|uniref:DUF3052 family protein n=2 Tax=Amycolatopsis cihanbeyliensis TaxID=1128664 RepID=A0A542DPT1_AMYCI|nr:hypothetical protein FB471_4937 [Amycolatopsis cihanbeyliensis]
MAGLVAKKMGIKEGARAFFMNAPAEAIEAVDPPEISVGSSLEGEFDYIHLFVKSQAELDDLFPRLKPHLAPKGSLWVSWPKGRKLGTDLNLKIVINICYNHGLAESKCLSVDSTWTALKFTHPIKGKVYNNSYGTLKLDP